jgi:hypothetical protein
VYEAKKEWDLKKGNKKKPTHNKHLEFLLKLWKMLSVLSPLEMRGLGEEFSVTQTHDDKRTDNDDDLGLRIGQTDTLNE